MQLDESNSHRWLGSWHALLSKNFLLQCPLHLDVDLCTMIASSCGTLKFEHTTKVLAKRMQKYYRISLCAMQHDEECLPEESVIRAQLQQLRAKRTMKSLALVQDLSDSTLALNDITGRLRDLSHGREAGCLEYCLVYSSVALPSWLRQSGDPSGDNIAVMLSCAYPCSQQLN